MRRFLPGALACLFLGALAAATLAQGSETVAFRGVVLAEGVPVPGAEVRWLVFSAEPGRVLLGEFRAVTNGGGSFEFLVPEELTRPNREEDARTVIVEASAPGLAPSVSEIYLGRCNRASVHFVEPIQLDGGCSLRGRVLDGRTESPAPLAGARVVIHRDELDRVTEVTSGNDGTFELPFLEDAWYSMGAWHPELSPQPMTSVRPCRGSGPEAADEMVFVLNDSASHYSGVVEDGGGRPLPGVRVSVGVRPPRGVPLEWLGADETITDAKGEFSLSGPGADVDQVLRLRKRGFEDNEYRIDRFASGRRDRVWGPRKLWMWSVLEVFGSVSDQEGEAVEGALAELLPERPPGRPGTGRAMVTDLADDSGMYSLEAPGPGRYLLRVSQSGFRVHESLLDLREEAVEIPEEDVVLIPDHWVDLTVQLLDENGHPVGGGLVESLMWHGGAPTQSRTDSSGICVLKGLDPAQRVFLVAEVGELTAWLDLPSYVLEDPQPFAELRLRPIPGRLVDVQGYVTDLRGSPVAWANVTLGDPKLHSWDLRTLFTDAEGRFSIEALREGTYFLEIVAPEMADKVVRFKAVPGVPELAIEMWSGAVVTGYLLDRDPAVDGVERVFVDQVSPSEVLVPGELWVALRGYPSALLDASVSPDGSFRVERVPEGIYRVHTGVHGTWHEAMVEISEGQDSAFVELLRVPVVERRRPSTEPPAGPTFSLEVSMKWSDGARLEMAWYDLVAASGRVVDSHRGQAEWEGIPAGSYTLRASFRYGEIELPVEVPGPPVEIEVPLLGAARLRVLDLELDFGPGWLDGVDTELTPLLTEAPATTVRAKERLTVGGLVPGWWRAEVRDQRGRIWSGELEVAARAERTVFLD